MSVSQVDEIKNKLDIVDLINGYVRLQKAGRNYKANCPFHSEKTPSFMVSPERQIWRCFGCGKGGSIFDFIMEMEGVEFGDALKILAQRAGIELKRMDPKLRTERTHLYEICDLANRFFVRQLASQDGKKIQDYLVKRGLNANSIKEWMVGYAPDNWRSLMEFLNSRGYPNNEILKTGLVIKNEQGKYYDRFRSRVMFPISDINGIVVGFTGRENPFKPDEKMGKYINTPNTLIYDKSKIVYGLNKAKLDIRKENSCVLVEGQTDVIMAHQNGFKNVVASSGTALTEYQLRFLKRYTENLATAFDMDIAGEGATKRGVNLAIELGFNAKIINLPNNSDPADCLQKDASIWKEAIDKAENLIEFHLKSALAKNNPETAEGKKEIGKAVLPIIKSIPSKIEQSHWLQETARRLSVREGILIEEMEKIRYSPSITKEPEINVANSRNHKIDLEEYVLGLILSCSKNPKECRLEPSHLFNNADFSQIFEGVKKFKEKEINLDQLKKTLPIKLANQIDHLVFQTEAQKEMTEDFEPKKEIKFCFNQLKKRQLKEKLNQLGLAINKAEGEKDKITLKKLTQEFNKLAKEGV
ncbi:MAG: DNA primase [Candidatus Portnoybacteria bacterium]